LHVKSIATFLREWIQSRESLARVETTAKKYRGIAENFLKHLGEQRGNGSIASLTAGEVEAWRNAEIQAGKGKTTADQIFALDEVRERGSPQGQRENWRGSALQLERLPRATAHDD